jgi:hypothetical protein
MKLSTMRIKMRSELLFFVVLIGLVLTIPQHLKAAQAITDTTAVSTVDTGEIQFTDAPSATEKIIAKKKADSVAKASVLKPV